jgi:arylsulfatase A-like enzyme
LFGHGVSLYETELHVPLLIIPPGDSATGQAVKEAVSLRDLATTIVDLVGQQAGSPFPGVSLARFWKQPGRAAPIELAPALPALAEVVLPYNSNKRVPQERSPLGAVKGGEWSYIRHEADGREELFHLSEDAQEERDLAGAPSARATLEQMRALLYRMTGGPLLPERFSR